MLGRSCCRWFRAAGAPFTFIGGPLRIGGENHRLSGERLVARLPSHSGGGPMTIHLLSGYISVQYIVDYGAERPLLLLDSGTLADVTPVRFFAEHVLKRQSGKANPFGLVVATHAHPDHSGGAPHHAAKGIPIAAPRGIDGYWAGLGGWLQLRLENFLANFVAHRLGRCIEWPLSRGVVPNPTGTTRLSDGVHLPEGYEDWTALGMPGHTSHMVGLYHGATHTLYCADLLIGINGSKFMSPVPVDIPWAYEHTMTRLRALPVRWLLLAHSGAVDVDSIPGGWPGIIDQVMEHLAQVGKSKNVMLNVINKLMLGWNSDAKGFSPSDLPKGPLPTAAEVPQPLTLFKDGKLKVCSP
eukprot:Hpha_TRINITY_DN6594_c0_g2::TRINITY_DN6594_c0_g2_i1::g.45904::m.45904